MMHFWQAVLWATIILAVLVVCIVWVVSLVAAISYILDSYGHPPVILRLLTGVYVLLSIIAFLTTLVLVWGNDVAV